jgi:lysophospholipase L1-like esterase
MKKILTFILIALSITTIAFADEPFRNHRYDAFKVLPVNSEQIVFVGNSITNMHEWWEAFGNHNVVNRGVSGAVTDEALANIEAIAAGKPKKVFFMLGTNNLGTNGINTTEHVLTNAKLLVERFQATSPATEYSHP